MGISLFRTSSFLFPASRTSLPLTVSYAEAILKRDKWTPILRPFVKGELPEKCGTRFVPNVSLCGIRQGDPQNRYTNPSLAASVKGELPEKRNTGFVPNLSLFNRPNCNVFPLLWHSIWATILDAQMRIQQYSKRSFSIWIDFPVARSQSSH